MPYLRVCRWQVSAGGVRLEMGLGWGVGAIDAAQLLPVCHCQWLLLLSLGVERICGTGWT